MQSDVAPSVPGLSALSPNDHDPLELTPIRAHYLKKTLIQLQFTQEIQAITSNNSAASTLAYLGPPFSPPPRDAPLVDLPFLRYLFRQFLLTFPFLAAAPKDFFPDKVQPFVSSLISRNLNSTPILDDQSVDTAGTAKIISKAERSFALFLNYAVKTVEKEEIVRLSQSDLDRLETIAQKRHAKLMKKKDVFEVNVVCVRTLVDKGRVRSKVHEVRSHHLHAPLCLADCIYLQEFIIRTRRSHFKDVYVSRRYGDFRTLYNEVSFVAHQCPFHTESQTQLRKAHPDEEIRPPPTKDRTYVSSRAPLGPTTSNTSASFEFPASGTNDPQPHSPVIPAASPSHRLAREKNRLTLRAYLHTLMFSTTIASSLVIKSFLLSDPTTLTNDELEDAERREEADRTRDEGRKQFSKEVSARVDSLRGLVKGVKGDLLGKGQIHSRACLWSKSDHIIDGLTRMFAAIKTTDNVHDLPPDLRAAIEWGRISLVNYR